MKCTCSGTLSSFDVWEACKEVAKLNKTLTFFSDSKHVEWLGLVGSESKIQNDEFSKVKLEISFKANSPQESNLALLEIVQAATLFFQRSLEENYCFNAPGSKNVDTQRLGEALKVVQNINKEVAEGTE